MKKLFISLFLFINFVFIFAESEIEKEAKDALKKYAGYTELQNRGFTLNIIDGIESAQDLYNVLLPYMIIDGKPLDNCISFNDFNFIRHKNIILENVYGKKDELIKKGYSENQIFYYPAAGKDVYRVGKFEWGTVPDFPSLGTEFRFYERPFCSAKTAYFWIGAFSENTFEPFYKEISSKKNIVLDLRGCSGGWGGRVRLLGQFLEKKKYKGNIVILVDRTTKWGAEDVLLYEMKTGQWKNGVQEKGSLNWFVVGENTLGCQKYIYNTDWNCRSDNLYFSPLPLEENNQSGCKEGEGIEPDIWAVGDEDIIKTVELITGDKTFGSLVEKPFLFHNKMIGNSHFFWNDNWTLPSQFKSIKKNDEFNKEVSLWIDNKLKLQKVNVDAQNKLYDFGGWYFNYPECFNAIKEPEQYNEFYSKWIDIRSLWVKTLIENKEPLYNMGGWFWEMPESLSKVENPQNYLTSFNNWINLRVWWITFIVEHKEVIQTNSFKIYRKDLDELFPDSKDIDLYISQLDSYLKEQSKWIDYLKPHNYVIPASYDKAKKYSGASEKIGKKCSAVPEEIRNLQKTNPAEYVEKMVLYINSVAQNDFEKVQMVFNVEQEIFRYDGKERDARVMFINQACKDAGEDYEVYKKKLDELWKNSGKEPKNQDWETAIRTGLCVCDGYAQVMQWFCYNLGIKCDRIFNPEDMYFAEGHTWNIVQIEGEDYLLDATWGYGNLFTEPEKFYKNGHFPRQEEQQLLENPYTLEQFKKR